MTERLLTFDAPTCQRCEGTGRDPERYEGSRRVGTQLRSIRATCTRCGGSRVSETVDCQGCGAPYDSTLEGTCAAGCELGPCCRHGEGVHRDSCGAVLPVETPAGCEEVGL